MMKVPILVAVGVSEAGARGLHASQATVPEMDRADQEHQGHQSALQQVGLCVGIARKKNHGDWICCPSHGCLGRWIAVRIELSVSSRQAHKPTA